MNDEPQGFPWIPLIIGIVIGLVGGVYYAWYLNPVKLDSVSPQQLVPADQQAYILMIGEAYLQDSDLERAKARLASLGIRDTAEAVLSQANGAYLGGDDPQEVRALTVLAEALGKDPLAADVFSGTMAPTTDAGTPTPTFSGMPSPTPSPTVPTPTQAPIRPTPTQTPVLIPPNSTLKLVALETVCQDDYPSGRIEVWVNGTGDAGIPAIKILVEWAGQQETFFTGLKPELGLGYADFQMEPNQSYSVTLVGLAEPVVGIISNACVTPLGQVSIPTYQLVYEPTLDQP